MNTLIEQLKGTLFENGSFKDEITIELANDEKRPDDHDMLLTINGFSIIAMVGNDLDLSIDLYARDKKEKVPYYMIEVIGAKEVRERFFAKTLLDLNGLLKEIEPLMSIARHIDTMGIKSSGTYETTHPLKP